MEIEQLEIRDFLASCAPLGELNSASLDDITMSIEIRYARRGTELLVPGEQNQWLYVVRTGALEMSEPDGSLVTQLGSSECIGYRSLLRGGTIHQRATAIEDSLLYQLPSEHFHRLIEQYPQVAQYFSEDRSERLRGATLNLREAQDNALLSTQAHELVKRKALQVTPATSIQQAAEQLAEARKTALLVMHDDEIQGIVTQTAFCNLVVAQGLDPQAPVTSIMTADPITLEPDALGSEAMLLMARHGFSHLPVAGRNGVLGIINAADLIRTQSHNTVYLVDEIYRARTLQQLKALSAQLPMSMVSLVQASLTAYDIGHAISSIGEAITRRLLSMAESKFGPPPVPYAFIVAGSVSRNEQTAHSDQDNAIILSDDYNEEAHGEYFKTLAEFVTDGLDACGYIYCPGDVMARNPKWRQPQKVWHRYFRQWIDSPEPKALMYASIFFDLRCIHGDAQLLNDLQDEVLRKTKGNTIFLSFLSANALSYHPPLGLFRHLVLEAGGGEEKALDLKKRGVVPIIDLARVYALAAGVQALNTQERLEAAAQEGAVSTSGMADLRDALEFISTVRLQRQAHQIQQGEEPSNFVPPETLSSLETRHLKDAFEVVRTMQSALRARFYQ